MKQKTKTYLPNKEKRDIKPYFGFADVSWVVGR